MSKKTSDNDGNLLDEDTLLPRSWRFMLRSNKIALLILFGLGMVMLLSLEAMQTGFGMLIAVLFGIWGFYRMLFKK